MKKNDERFETAMQLGDIVHIVMDRMSGKAICLPGHSGKEAVDRRRKDKKQSQKR
jgi:hypothetical protein